MRLDGSTVTGRLISQTEDFFLAMLYLSPAHTVTQAAWVTIRLDAWVAHKVLDWVQDFKRIAAWEPLQEVVYRLPVEAPVVLYGDWPELQAIWTATPCNEMLAIRGLPTGGTLAYAISAADLSIKAVAGERDRFLFTVLAHRSNSGTVKSNTFSLALIEEAAASNIKSVF